MPVDRGLDFLRVHLQAAHIDDSVLAADEVIAIAVPFHHVAGIDESFAVEERRSAGSDVSGCGACRAQPQRAVLDLDVDVAGAGVDEVRRKALQAVIDLEGDARLGRCIGVAEPRAGVHRPQIVEHGLVLRSRRTGGHNAARWSAPPDP